MITLQCQQAMPTGLDSKSTYCCKSMHLRDSWVSEGVLHLHPELGDAFTLRLCEQLLSSDTCADADQEGEKSGILLKYVQVLLTSSVTLHSC